MKEVQSQSRWVGRIVTCKKCQRSYTIEVGDILHNGTSYNAMSFDRHFKLPCQHEFVVRMSDSPEYYKLIGGSCH